MDAGVWAAIKDTLIALNVALAGLAAKLLRRRGWIGDSGNPDRLHDELQAEAHNQLGPLLTQIQRRWSQMPTRLMPTYCLSIVAIALVAFASVPMSPSSLAWIPPAMK